MTIRAYVRVSTADQRRELQARELPEHAERQGTQFADINEDVSNGAKASPQVLNRLIAAARARKFTLWRQPFFPRGGKQLNMTAPTAYFSCLPGMKASAIVGASSSNRLVEGQRGEAEAVMLEVESDVV